MKNAPKLIVKLGSGFAGLLLLLLLLIAVNSILTRLPLRKDITAERLFTLSSGTRDVLKGLDRTVTLTLVFNASNPQIPGELRTYARRIEDLLRTFSMSSGGRVRFAKIDPQPDSEQEDWVQEHYGVTPRTIFGMDNPIFMGIVVSSGNRQERIAFADPGRENLMEYEVARLVTRVARAEKPVVAVLSSLPVLGSRGMPFAPPGQRQEEPWMAFQQLQEDADVREINPQSPEIPENTKVLIVAHPQNLPPALLFKIDQYVLRGGSCIVLVDPLCQAEMAAAQQNQMAMMMGGGPSGKSDLAPLLHAWGVTYDPGKLLIDPKAGTPIMMNQIQPDYQPFFLTFKAVAFNEEDILSAGLKLIQAPYAGAFKIKAPAGVTATPLMTASPKSGLVDALFARMPGASALRKFKPDSETLIVAARLQGKFPSAYPEGRPQPSGSDTEPAGEASGETLTNAVAPATVLVMADMDFLHNQFCQYSMAAEESLYGKPVQNASLLVNAVEIMAGNGALARIQARSKTLRPFTRVVELAYRAEEQWQDQDNRLQDEIEKLRGELQKLDVRRDKQVEIVLNPEQEAAIVRFNKQIKALEKEQKAVRRKLREGIEELGMRHKAFNILFAPALVIVVGGVYGFFKRRRKPRL